jgi:hypothetical protein
MNSEFIQCPAQVNPLGQGLVSLQEILVKIVERSTVKVPCLCEVEDTIANAAITKIKIIKKRKYLDFIYLPFVFVFQVVSNISCMAAA